MKIIITLLILSLSFNLLSLIDNKEVVIIEPGYKTLERAFGETAVDQSIRSCVVNEIWEKVTRFSDAKSQFESLPWEEIIKFQREYNDTDFDSGFFSRGTLPVNFINTCIRGNVKMISISDLNNDGLPELGALKYATPFLEIHRNAGSGFFTLEKFNISDPIDISSFAFNDVDGDGWVDILLLHIKNNTIEIFYNDGSGGFKESVISNGIFDNNVGHKEGNEYSITFADLDKNGLADLLYASRSFGANAKILYDASKIVRPIRVLYNTGDRNSPYKEETLIIFKNLDKSRKGLTTANTGDEALDYDVSGVFVAGVADFNNDGWLDIYGAGDIMRPYLFKADIGGKNFTDVSEISGIRIGGQNTMGVSILDYNNDGYMDIIATDVDRSLRENYMNRPGPIIGGHRLLINNKNLTFTDIGDQVGINNAGWGFGLSILDQNLDGYFDFLIATGDLPIGRNDSHWLTTYDKPYLLLQGKNGWERKGEQLLRALYAPVATPILYSGDLDGDKSPDLIFAGIETKNPYLLLNKTLGNSFNLTIKGAGKGFSPTGGEGAIIEVSIPKREKQIHTLPNLMSQYLASATNIPVTFGLGEAGSAVVKVTFPSGEIISRKVYAGNSYIISEVTK
jgi:hypothetical protein